LKIVVLPALCLLTVLAMAESSQFEVSINVDVREAREFLSLLNAELGLRLDEKNLANYAASIAIGNEHSDDVDIHHDGIVFTATYKIAKPKAGRVDLTFRMAQKRAAKAICQQMIEFSRTNDSRRSPSSCRYDLLERLKV
jgi:hypothetical protein